LPENVDWSLHTSSRLWKTVSIGSFSCRREQGEGCTSKELTGSSISPTTSHRHVPALIFRIMSTKARAFQEACRIRRLEAHGLSHTRTLASGTPARLQRLSVDQLKSSSKARSIQQRLPRAPCRHASSAPGHRGRAITVTSDDGRYHWNQLSTGEKAARGTQQTFNFVLVSLGLIGTVGAIDSVGAFD
jgi:hypothetical protein